LYSITDYVIEDVRAKSWKGRKKWNVNFSPVEVGKLWFYDSVTKLGDIVKKQGYETFEKRNLLGLKKSKRKMAETFDTHNVDSWVLASFMTGKKVIDNKAMFRMVPLQLHRRQLHNLESNANRFRKPYGGTMSLGFKRGSVVKHIKLGIVYIGGKTKGLLSLHSLINGDRITRRGSSKNFKFLYFNSWRTSWVNT
jgi:hypothetical protein